MGWMEKMDGGVGEKGVGYVGGLVWGGGGYVLLEVGGKECEGVGKRKGGMVMGFMGVVVKIGVKYMFIYGDLGMGEVGGVGCGVGSGGVYWVMLVGMVC